MLALLACLSVLARKYPPGMAPSTRPRNGLEDSWWEEEEIESDDNAIKAPLFDMKRPWEFPWEERAEEDEEQEGDDEKSDIDGFIVRNDANKDILFDAQLPSDFLLTELDDDDDDKEETTDEERTETSDMGAEFDGFVVKNAEPFYPFADEEALELDEDEYPFANTPAQE